MEDIDIARLKELAARATPGPWNTGKIKPLLVFSPNRQEAVADCAIFVSKTFDCDNAAQNAAYIAAASPDVVLGLIEEVNYWRGYAGTLEQEKGAYYVEFDRLAEELGVFAETDPGHPESFATFAEVYRNLRAEVERLKKLSELWKHDYEELAASASDGRKKNERLEKEADWLAEELAESRGECPYANDPDYWDGICKHENCVDNVMACWRAAARRSVEEECKS